MSKALITLILAAVAAIAQTPNETKTTPEQKGYHETKPRNTGATPPQSKEDKAARDKKKTTRDGLDTQKPPTHQPNLNPPGKP
jgi:hypothetical protein